MDPSGFNRCFRDNPTPDSNAAAMQLEQIISESPLSNENPNTPSSMDSIKNVWRHHPHTVYNLTDESTSSASTITDSCQPNAVPNPLEEVLNEMKARTEVLEKLAEEKKN
eukprot:3139437-Ditylum_brightwellii.AAC.1